MPENADNLRHAFLRATMNQLSVMRNANPAWSFRDIHWTPIQPPRLMGIVNVTPDSFSDGGTLKSLDDAVERAHSLVAAGADLLDIGGESTRPNAKPVSTDEEFRRVVPVIRAIADEISVPISIDTSKAPIARAALDAGATIVNDITGLTGDPEMIRVCRDHAAGIVCMHMQGTPATMQDNPHYEDVVGEIQDYFCRRLDAIDAAGIPLERVILDPGIGFGKTAAHNLELLASVEKFQDLGRPVLIGHSRKRFLKSLLGRPVEERTAGTIGVAVALASLGVDYLRVHDIAAIHDALLAWHTVMNHAELRGTGTRGRREIGRGGGSGEK